SSRFSIPALLGLLSAPLAAAEPDAAVPALQAPVGTGDVLSVAASLVLVVAAIVVCGWLYSRSQGLRIRGAGVISIVAAQPLGPKGRMLLLQVADNQLGVGMTSTQVSTLYVVDEPVLRPDALAEEHKAFGDRFRSILRGEAK